MHRLKGKPFSKADLLRVNAPWLSALRACAALLLWLAVIPARADLLYCGLTEKGWQVFHFDESSEKSRQLTFGVGDKRTPRYSHHLGSVLYRSPTSQIQFIENWDQTDERPKSKILLELDNCADFFPMPDGQIYFNRMATGNSQRRFAWMWDGKTPDQKGVKLVLRADQGSVRQIRISPNGKQAVLTHLWRRAEERLLVFDPNAPGNPAARKTKAVTPERTVSVYPAWLDDRILVFSRQVSEKNFDLYLLDLDGSEAKESPLLETKDSSEFAAVAGADGKTIYFEQVSTDGEPHLTMLDRESGKVSKLSIKIPAKEPWWFDPTAITK